MAEAIRVWVGDRELEFSGERALTVGRDASAAIRTDNPLVSRRHAVLEPQGDAWLLRDTGSKRGVYVDGRRVETTRVAGPTLVLLGDPHGGETLRLLPGVGATTAAQPAQPAPQAKPKRSHGRLAVAVVLVGVAAALTPRLLTGLSLPADLVEKLGLGWAAAIPAVDRFLGRRLPARGAQGGGEAFGLTQLFVYAAALCFGVAQASGFALILGPGAGLFALVLSLAVGAYVFFRLGRWARGRVAGWGIATLVGGAVLGISAVRLTDYVVFSPEQYELFLGDRTPGALAGLVGIAAVLWGSLAWFFGGRGLRKGAST